MIDVYDLVCITLYNLFLYCMLCNFLNIYEHKSYIINIKDKSDYNKSSKFSKIVFNIQIYTKVIITYNTDLLLSFLYFILDDKYVYIYKEVLKNDIKQCHICYDDIIFNPVEIKDCKCKGICYHDKCINKWLTINNSCPYCRHSIKSC